MNLFVTIITLIVGKYVLTSEYDVSIIAVVAVLLDKRIIYEKCMKISVKSKIYIVVTSTSVVVVEVIYKIETLIHYSQTKNVLMPCFYQN